MSHSPCSPSEREAGHEATRFHSFLAGAMAALPLAGRAQQKAVPVIGVLNTGSPGASPFMAAFLQGLSEAGYVEGQNVAIEYRYAEGQYDRLPALAADLVGPKVDLILGLQLHVLKASSESEIDTAFVSLVQLHADALVVGADPFLTNRREQLVTLASGHSVPSLYARREFAASGGLISYGASLASGVRLVGTYAGKVLKGAKPADM